MNSISQFCPEFFDFLSLEQMLFVSNKEKFLKWILFRKGESCILVF